MRNTYKIYLCGPIKNVSREESIGWRRRATELLLAIDKEGVEIHIIDPSLKDIPDSRIVASDLQDLEESDIVLANIPSGVQCIGSCMELILAHSVYGIPVIVFGHTDPDPSPWLKHCAKAMVPTLEIAVDWVLKVIGDEKSVRLSTEVFVDR
jgi:hypothetical protein